MKCLALIFLLLSSIHSLYDDPMREVELMEVKFPAHQQDIFLEYANDNFSQKLHFKNKVVTAEINSSNYLKLNLNFRITPDTAFMDTLGPEVKDIVLDLMGNDYRLKTYLKHISFYLDGNIEYSDNSLPQDAASVLLNKKAHCIGYSNVVKLFMDAAGIRTRMMRGFYLKKEDKASDTWTPVPHRWVELLLPNGIKFFYDPQYQRFAANYITTKRDIDFKQVKRFKVKVTKKTKKIIN